MNGWLTVGLLVVSNIFMTFAWYGQLKLQQMKVITSATPLITVILLSWGIALLEYCFMVPANRYGFHENGGAFSLLQLKVIQEVISLMIFTVFTILFFRGEALHWNHFLAFCLLIIAVYLVFMDS
ncbi:MAG: DMT family protein [Duncaniella sp.]|nr:DMT family protein [Duncaniella sp.]MDE5927433.1 DMT family protein [Duncaniella sp.]